MRLFEIAWLVEGGDRCIQVCPVGKKERIPKASVPSRGASVARSVLDAEQVKQMRLLYDLGEAEIKDLAEQYGVAYNTARGVIKGETWKHV